MCFVVVDHQPSAVPLVSSIESNEDDLSEDSLACFKVLKNRKQFSVRNVPQNSLGLKAEPRKNFMSGKILKIHDNSESSRNCQNRANANMEAEAEKILFRCASREIQQLGMSTSNGMTHKLPSQSLLHTDH